MRYRATDEGDWNKNFVTTFDKQSYECVYVVTPFLAQEILNRWAEKGENLYAIDIETMAHPQFKYLKTAALSPLTSRIRLMQVYDGETTYVFDLLKIENDEMFVPFLTSNRFVAHFAVFELSFFRMLGAANMQMGCTCIMLKLLFHACYPTDKNLSASLESAVNIYFGVPLKKGMQRSDWSVRELTFEQIEYAAIDAISVYRLAEKMAPAIQKNKMERIYKLYRGAQHPLTEMSLNGIGLDQEHHRSLIEDWRANLRQTKEEMVQATGLKKVTPHSVAAWLEENLDVETYNVWPETEGSGKLSTSADTFADFDWLPIVKPLAKYQKAVKLTTVYGEKLANHCSHFDKRIHAKFDISGARTGRLSSSKPNLQNLPRQKKGESIESSIRSAFVPRPGWIFLDADYSQIELRVAAEISQDQVMLDAFANGIDLHALTASRILEKLISEVTKDERQMAKAFNFGLLFGLGAAKFSHYAKKSYGVETDHEGAIHAIAVFRSLYPGYRQWQIEQGRNCKSSGYVRTPCGKLRCLHPDETYGAGLNTPIQGGAAECMLYSIIFLYERLFVGGFQAQFVNCVHDELLIECPLEEVDSVSALVVEEMTRGYLEVFPQGITNNLVEVKTGYSWAAAK